MMTTSSTQFHKLVDTIHTLLHNQSQLQDSFHGFTQTHSFEKGIAELRPYSVLRAQAVPHLDN